MNKDNAKQYIPLLEALADGELQAQDANGHWFDQDDVEFFFNLVPERYRRKPKPREFDLYLATDGVPGFAYSDDERKPILSCGRYIRVREVIE